VITSLPADIREVQEAGHQVVPRIFTRTPKTGVWVELNVLEGSITYAPAGTHPGRTVTARCLLEATGTDNVTGPADLTTVDWLTAPLSPYGSWLRVEQQVTRMAGTTFTVPWGYFRVDTLQVDALTATVQIEASDGSAQVGDRPFVTLGQSKVAAADFIGTVMTRMITDCYPAGITPFWTPPILDLGGLTDKKYGGKGGVYADQDRLDALGILGAKLTSGARLIFPRTGSLARLIVPDSDTAAGEAYVLAKANLIFTEFGDRVEREGLFNEVVVTYEKQAASAYGQTRVQQKRVIAQYLDAGEELSAAGPFGWATRETTAADIPEGTADPDAYAQDLALDAMGRSFSAARVVTLSSGPIYALEQGDAVYVQVEATGVRKRGILTGATIPLNAAGGPWQLEVTMTDPLDANWKPHYLVDVDETEYEDNFTWRSLKSATTVDLDAGRGSGKVKKAWRGWTIDNASKTVGGGGLTATSNGGQVVLRTSQSAWSESVAEHRYRGKASITAPNGAIKARVGIDTNTQGVIWGDWKSFTKGKSQTVSVDTERSVNPAAVTFGLRIETSGMKSGEQVRMNSASVERALRNKT
jgi:hypothetical protein